MKKFSFLLAVLLALRVVAEAQTPAFSTRVLLIPLDDRPTSTQFTTRMGLIGNAEVVTPPRELLGRFTTAGQSDQIIEWARAQDLQSYDVVIVALDMLAYGGLVGSRMHRVSSEEALKRVEALRELKQRMPRARLYAQNVVMRLAPTPGDKNEAYRVKLEHWAEISVAHDAKSKEETAALEREIPEEVLNDYKMARRRNLLTNLKALELVQEGVIDYLILSQDDAKPQGVHVADREKLIAEVHQKGLTQKVAVQPGADEVSMLLLARALTQYHTYQPKIKAVFSSAQQAAQTMPFEDRPLRQTVGYHIRATGAQEVESEQEADILFYVYTSRLEEGRSESFAREIENKIGQGRQVIVADIDPVGDVQGGDPQFMLALMKRNLFPRLNGFASWNTAGNTIGTALPHGVVFSLATQKLLSRKELASRIWSAQHWFLIHRVMDDYYFHTLVREKTNAYLDQRKRSSVIMSDEKTRQAQVYSQKQMDTYFKDFTRQYLRTVNASRQIPVRCQIPSEMQFSLPWNRMFEADIHFDITCKAL
ncbi:DUF4127 family protein [Telluribacter sp. SYSU D00476]|uniref:DUF4127 family protein n=1 Tax=Telluribacter sp. SYSU D00476 TaxID=2811430 RepID=UPI001FF6AB3C|nr:DUF4127 family protein [Telluribacter sp. SYSU D00476]